MAGRQNCRKCDTECKVVEMRGLLMRGHPGLVCRPCFDAEMDDRAGNGDGWRGYEFTRYGVMSFEQRREAHKTRESEKIAAAKKRNHEAGLKRSRIAAEKRQRRLFDD